MELDPPSIVERIIETRTAALALFDLQHFPLPEGEAVS
jgi:hypothetical protein